MVTRQITGVSKDAVAAIIAQFKAEGCEAAAIPDGEKYTVNANCPDAPAADAAPIAPIATAIKPTARTKAK
ncbi:hypothetical protein ACO0LF_30680 [Undibacterium sp. Di27W]|uniref:hypothetical protein n=1 Tax=Undibacterium sp. Di27W TaxID=3413036 RepID=UPI003BF37821